MGFKDKKKNLKRHNKKLAKVEKKKLLKAPVSSIENVELLSKEQVKKIVVNSTCATRASGKRKRRMLKRIKHAQKPKNLDDTEVDMEAGQTAKSKTKKSAKTDEMDTS